MPEECACRAAFPGRQRALSGAPLLDLSEGARAWKAPLTGSLERLPYRRALGKFGAAGEDRGAGGGGAFGL